MAGSTRARIAAALAATALAPGAVAHARVAGVVVDAAGGAPIPGALVSVQASDVETRTGDDGSFALEDAAGTNLPITAAAFGFFTASVRADGGTSDVRIELEAVPAEEDPTYPFASPLSCSHCHWSQYAAWSDSAMAHAGRNTWVADVYAGNGTSTGMGGFVYVRDSAHAGDDEASECASCHQPVAWAKEPFSALAPPVADDFDVDEGVSCDICHKIAEVDESRMNFGSPKG